MDGDWNDYRVALAIAREGTMRAAGLSLGVSHTTVGRRLVCLEKALGSRLFDRTPGGLRATLEGERVVEAAAALESEIAGVERKVGSQDSKLEGRVVLTMPDLLASHVLVEHFARFCALYPQIELEIIPTYDILDLARREADVAVRFVQKGSSPAEELVGRKASDLFSCAFASPEYLERTTLDSSDSAARWLGWGERAITAPWLQRTAFPDLPLWGGFNHPYLQAEAARQGLGLSYLPVFLGDRWPGLVRVPGSELASNWDLWVLVHPDLRRTARLRVLRDFVIEALHEESERGKALGLARASGGGS
ncbi:MAG: LysR family transcriptional regulator [Deltaproteobacteria bacterium]|nr:LysR family transcriptional regulator [Deltaproteobacteria bacterium]